MCAKTILLRSTALTTVHVGSYAIKSSILHEITTGVILPYSIYYP